MGNGIVRPTIWSVLQKFSEEFKNVFDSRKDASYLFTTISQGSRTVANYAVDFRTLAADSPLNEKDLHPVRVIINGLWYYARQVRVNGKNKFTVKTKNSQ